MWTKFWTALPATHTNQVWLYVMRRFSWLPQITLDWIIYVTTYEIKMIHPNYWHFTGKEKIDFIMNIVKTYFLTKKIWRMCFSCLLNFTSFRTTELEHPEHCASYWCLNFTVHATYKDNLIIVISLNQTLFLRVTTGRWRWPYISSASVNPSVRPTNIYIHLDSYTAISFFLFHKCPCPPRLWLHLVLKCVMDNRITSPQH